MAHQLAIPPARKQHVTAWSRLALLWKACLWRAEGWRVGSLKLLFQVIDVVHQCRVAVHFSTLTPLSITGLRQAVNTVNRTKRGPNGRRPHSRKDCQHRLPELL